MYNQKHAKDYWQRKKESGETVEINRRNKAARAKHYENNKGRLLESARIHRHNNYIKCALQRIKSRCKRLDIIFDLEPCDITLPSHCPVFGIELSIGRGRGALDNSPSFDRIVPSLGYVRGNVIIVSNKANRMKNSGSIEEMKQLVNYYERL